MKQIILIAHNLRSTHNVGSLLRTAEGLGVSRVFLTGYTPYPLKIDDSRLPHEARKLNNQIQKTALGAEDSIQWQHEQNIQDVIKMLRNDNFVIAGLEQTPTSVKLPEYQAPDKLVIIVGREVEGVEPDVLANCDVALEIPMFGHKESFNVVQAAAMALYHCRFSV